jgi:hypothetical protein
MTFGILTALILAFVVVLMAIDHFRGKQPHR